MENKARIGPIKLKKKRRFDHRLIPVVIIAVLLIGGGIYLYVIQKHQNTKKNENTAYQSLEVNAKDAAEHNQNNKVVSLSLGFLNNYKSNASKSQLYTVDTALAVAYSNLQNYKNAASWQLDAIDNTLTPTSNDYSNLAGMYDNSKNYAQSLKYYELALTKLSTNKVAIIESDNQANVINQKIELLETINDTAATAK